jgi:hypothetical protein
MQRNLVKAGCFLFLIMTGYAHAQSFKNKAVIDSVTQSGFYAIEITPELSSLVATDFSDLRIFDQSGKPVPYLIGSHIPLMDSTLFHPLTILKNTENDSGQSVLLIANSGHAMIDAFYLRIQNAAVSRTISLSGSNDGLKWFSIIENLGLERRFIQDKDSFVENISFPLSSYKFFRIVIYNGKNDPLDVLSVHRRIHPDTTERISLFQNPAISYSRKDSSRITWLRFDNARAFHISHVFIHVKSPRFFKRQADLLVGDIPAGNFVISSDSVFDLSLPVFNDSVFTVKIYNEDNPSLDITGASTAQNEDRIIAYLESGKTYRMEMTNKQAGMPHYDLINFKDSIPKNIKIIGVSKPVPASIAQLVADDNLNHPWLWPVLVFVLIVMGLFTYGLTKDMAKRP